MFNFKILSAISQFNTPNKAFISEIKHFHLSTIPQSLHTPSTAACNNIKTFEPKIFFTKFAPENY